MTTHRHHHPVERDPENFSAAVEFGMGNSLLERLFRAVGPLAGGLILDYVDFITFGPAGIPIGLIVGFAVGYWVSRIYGFSNAGRAIFAALAAAYCAIPFTNLLPLATIIACVARFSHDGARAGDQSSEPEGE